MALGTAYFLCYKYVQIVTNSLNLTIYVCKKQVFNRDFHRMCGKLLKTLLPIFTELKIKNLGIFGQVFFYHFKFKSQFFAAKNKTQIVFPEFSRKAQFRIFDVEIDEEFDAQSTPQIH